MNVEKWLLYSHNNFFNYLSNNTILIKQSIKEENTPIDKLLKIHLQGYLILRNLHIRHT